MVTTKGLLQKEIFEFLKFIRLAEKRKQRRQKSNLVEVLPDYLLENSP